MAIDGRQLAAMTDCTTLGITSTKDDIMALISTAKKYGFCSVATSLTCWHPMIARELKGSGVKLIGAASFYQGAEGLEVKTAMAKWALAHGCDEIESWLNYTYFKSGMYDEVVKEIATIRETIGPDVIYKVILETPLWTDEEIAAMCELCIDGGVNFVKTGTGTLGATTVHTIEVMAKAIKGRAKMKASGGIRTLETVDQMVDLGVARFGIGMTSAVKLVEEANKR